jgi:ABC-type dipeptide/oligopeptide/nickel transport system ATPase component
VHGACLDIDGKGLCIIGNPGAGKTTQTYGLLKDPQSRIVSDDWFFSRVYGPDILAYGSERNFYIRKDLATVWQEYDGLVPEGDFDKDGRAVANLRWVIGKGRILPMTTLKTMILLKRDPGDTSEARSIGPEDGLKIFEENAYFNPHLLVNNSYKKHIRKQYITSLLDRTIVYLVNTTSTPQETQRLIRSLANVPQIP